MLCSVVVHICFLMFSYFRVCAIDVSVIHPFLKEAAMRIAFKKHMKMAYQFAQSNELLLNTLDSYVIARLRQGEFPISDKFDEYTVVVIEVSFPKEPDGEYTLGALHEVFSVSISITTPLN